MPSCEPLPIEISTARVDGTSYLAVSGELDMATAPLLRDALTEESAKGGTLVLDIRDLEFIDAKGIRLLLVAWRASRVDGFNLRLTRASDAVMRALEIVDVVDDLPF